MLSCWHAHPQSRPSFDTLENSFKSLLPCGVAEHYIDLNEPHTQSNLSDSNRTDFLSMMASPTTHMTPNESRDENMVEIFTSSLSDAENFSSVQPNGIEMIVMSSNQAGVKL